MQPMSFLKAKTGWQWSLDQQTRVTLLPPPSRPSLSLEMPENHLPHMYITITVHTLIQKTALYFTVAGFLLFILRWYLDCKWTVQKLHSTLHVFQSCHNVKQKPTSRKWMILLLQISLSFFFLTYDLVFAMWVCSQPKYKEYHFH